MGLSGPLILNNVITSTVASIIASIIITIMVRTSHSGKSFSENDTDDGGDDDDDDDYYDKEASQEICSSRKRNVRQISKPGANTVYNDPEQIQIQSGQGFRF